MKALAVDLGASSGRVLSVLLDDKLGIEELHRFETPHRTEAAVEKWNVPVLLDEIHRGIMRANGAHSIGIDTWGVDFGLIAKNGDLISNPIRYRDKSHHAGFEKLKELIPQETAYSLTGIQPQPFNTAAQLLARKLRNDSELAQAKTFALMPNLLAGLLAKSAGFACELTNASTTQMLSLQGTWCDEIAGAIGLAPEFMPELACAGSSAGQLGGIQILNVATHDTASAVAACPLQYESAAYISSGTWSLVGVELDAAITSLDAMNSGFTNEIGIEKTRFLKNVMGLWLLQQCTRKNSAECVALAKQSASFVAKFNVNAPCLLNPEDMPAAIRALADAKIEDERSLFRCIFENLAAEYARVVKQIYILTGKKIESINIIGGGSQNYLLNQMTADACGVPVFAGPSEASALGNALVQFAAARRIANVRAEGRELVAKSFERAVFHPKNTQAWQDWVNA